MKKPKQEKKKLKRWQKLLIALGALVVAAALAVGGLTLTMHLSHARFMKRSLGSEAVQAFGAVLEAMPFEEYEPVRWRLAAPDGGAWFAYDNFNITMVADAAPFVAAGLDVAKLENAVEHNLNPGNGSISFDTPGFDMLNAWGKDTDIEQFAWALGNLEEYLVTLEDRYYIDLGDGSALRGGALFAWAKDLSAGENDIVFAINPEPLIAAGVDPAKVEGWDYIQMPVLQDGTKILAYQFVKAFDIKGTNGDSAPGPFATARRIVATDDLRYDNDNNPIVEQGEVLVRFHYMDTFDVEVWKASTVIQVAWDIEAITHAVYLDMRAGPTKIDPYALSQTEEYDFGVAVSEIWMLPEEAYTAAFRALEAEAKGAEAKEFWLVPKNYSGILNPKYNADTSIRVDSFLPEQLRPNAEPIHMSTELMREYFPFLGEADIVLATLPSVTAPVSTTEPPKGTVLTEEMQRETEQDGLVLRINTGHVGQFTGEPFTLTASITNNFRQSVTYGVGSGTPDVHMEIQVRIPGFTDLDIEGKIWTDDYRLAILKAGETFTETIRFSPNALPAGEYEGTAVFTYFTGTMESPGEQKQLELKFPVVLV